MYITLYEWGKILTEWKERCDFTKSNDLSSDEIMYEIGKLAGSIQQVKDLIQEEIESMKGAKSYNETKN